MSTTKTLSRVYFSLLRAVNDLIEEAKTETGNANIEYWSWESRLDEDQMPTATLIGLDGYSFLENNGLWIIRCAVTVSSYNDANLHNEAGLLDLIYDRFGELKTIPLRNPESGEIESELVNVNFDVMPMAQSEMRNYRTIALEFLRTQNER